MGSLAKAFYEEIPRSSRGMTEDGRNIGVMIQKIHPSAVIEDGATLGSNVQVGPFCHVGKDVVLHDNVILHSHAVVVGNSIVGEGTEIFSFAAVGHVPQDLKFTGEMTKLEIGANCKIREHATLHPGTEGGGGVTRVGDNCLLMVGAHVAHDCHVGNHVIMANNATLAGHVTVGDHTVIGGLSAVHQFVSIGQHAMIGGMSGVENDVIPYGTVTGERAHLSGLNLVGLKRRGFDKTDINALRAAYKTLFADEGTLEERVASVEAVSAETVETVLSFIASDARTRPLCLPD